MASNEEETEVVSRWECQVCEVRGQTREREELECWNCGGPVTVTAKPTIAREIW